MVYRPNCRISMKQSFMYGVVSAIFCAIIVFEPTIHCFTATQEELGLNWPIEWYMRIIGFFIFSSPVWLSLTALPIFVYTFVNTTAAAEDRFIDFIRK